MFDKYFSGIILGLFQGFLSAWVGIPSFVVTLAGLLGFQGLMLKILEFMVQLMFENLLLEALQQLHYHHFMVG